MTSGCVHAGPWHVDPHVHVGHVHTAVDVYVMVLVLFPLLDAGSVCTPLL